MKADPKTIVLWVIILVLPMTALLSAHIAVALRHTEGPIKFEVLDMKFEGSSGQLVLWIFNNAGN